MRRTTDKGAENILKIPKFSETNNIPSREAMQKALEDRIGKSLMEKFSRGGCCHMRSRRSRLKYSHIPGEIRCREADFGGL